MSVHRNAGHNTALNSDDNFLCYVLIIMGGQC